MHHLLEHINQDIKEDEPSLSNRFGIMVFVNVLGIIKTVSGNLASFFKPVMKFLHILAGV